jgi:hypothetical protein
MGAQRRLGPTRLPRDSQVEQDADFSRTQMLAGLRAYERSDMCRVPTVHRFPVLDGEGQCAVVKVVSRLPLRGSPGGSPGSLLSHWPRDQEHQHRHYILWFDGRVKQYVVGR